MAEMNLMPLGEQEYNELLLQAVAEIEKCEAYPFTPGIFDNLRNALEPWQTALR